MARKRQLDPEFFTDEEIGRLSPLARLFYQGTWCHCEDTGVFEVKPVTLKTQILPYDQVSAEDLYKEIKKEKFYIEFVIDEKKYAFIKGFHKRQVIQHPSISILPLPPKPWVDMMPDNIRKNNKFKKSH